MILIHGGHIYDLKHAREIVINNNRMTIVYEHVIHESVIYFNHELSRKTTESLIYVIAAHKNKDVTYRLEHLIELVKSDNINPRVTKQ